LLCNFARSSMASAIQCAALLDRLRLMPRADLV